MTNNILTGLTGAMGLYSGVKGLFESSAAKKKQKSLLSQAKQEENDWFKRNYYNDYFNSTEARAAIKRVENSLKKKTNENRAAVAVTGQTPEYSLALNAQNMDVLDNFNTKLALNSDAKRERAESIYRNNLNALKNSEFSNLARNESDANQHSMYGMKLLSEAISGLNFGKE